MILAQKYNEAYIGNAILNEKLTKYRLMLPPASQLEPSVEHFVVQSTSEETLASKEVEDKIDNYVGRSELLEEDVKEAKALALERSVDVLKEV